jgi:hypothetical protein
VDPAELAFEMAAARKRREEKTATQLREARAHAIRAGMRPGSTREAIEERARSFYPRLSAELLDEAVTMVYGGPADVVTPQAEPVVVAAEQEIHDELDIAIDLVE